MMASFCAFLCLSMGTENSSSYVFRPPTRICPEHSNYYYLGILYRTIERIGIPVLKMKLPDVSLEHIFLAAMERGKKEKRFWGIIDGLYILLTFSLRAYIIPVSLSFHRHPTPLSGRSLLE